MIGYKKVKNIIIAIADRKSHDISGNIAVKKVIHTTNAKNAGAIIQLT